MGQVVSDCFNFKVDEIFKIPTFFKSISIFALDLVMLFYQDTWILLDNCSSSKFRDSFIISRLMKAQLTLTVVRQECLLHIVNARFVRQVRQLTLLVLNMTLCSHVGV